MNTLKRSAIILAVGTFLILLTSLFGGKDISSRSIVLGIGLDYDPETEIYSVTAEVVSPEESQDQGTGSFSKLIEGNGPTPEEAVYDIFVRLGRVPSLGQCLVVLLGDGLYNNVEVQSAVTFFSYLNSFKDSSTVCCVKGSARQMMQNKLPVGKSFSFSLVELLGSSQRAGVISQSVSGFVRSQAGYGKCGYMTFVDFEEEKVTQQQKEEAFNEGSLVCNTIAVFKDFKYVDRLTVQQTKGFSLVQKGYIGQLYTVTKDDQPFSLYVSSKNVNLHYDSKAIADINISLEVLRVGDGDPENVLYLRRPKTITEEQLRDATEQIYDDVAAFFEVQQQLEVDITGLVKQRDNLKEGDAEPLEDVDIILKCDQH